MTEFESIYEEYRPKIHRYLGSLIGEADAGDLTQTVFLKVSRSLENFRGDSSLSTWIYRIATNTARDHAASCSAKGAREVLLEADSSFDDFPDDAAPRADDEFIRREMNECIRGVIENLPDNYRTVLLLSDFEGLRNSDIAEILETSIETVKIRLHRARTALRTDMERQCNFYHDRRSELMCDRK